MGLAKTGRYWPYIPDNDITPQRFQAHFMRKKLDTIMACNDHNTLSGRFQYGVKASLLTVNLTGRKTGTGRDPLDQGSWTWKIFRDQGTSSIHTATLYRPVPP